MFKKNLKLLIIILLSIFLLSCSFLDSPSFSKNNIEVHFIDVGQGDSILIHVNNKTMLIDSGPKESAPSLIHYLNKYNIKTIDYLVATHPHEDHIGNMDSVIKRYNVLNFYSPKTPTTGKTYENMIDALKSKNLKIRILNSNTNSINLGKDTFVKVLSPEENETLDNSNLNNASAVLLIKYKSTSFLFTGDAEKESENSILAKNSNIKANVLKLGHHGSDSSTTESFLKAISPSIGVISAGEDNMYGHPHKSTLKRLKAHKIKIFRTDTDGNIKIISDGNKISCFKKNKR